MFSISEITEDADGDYLVPDIGISTWTLSDVLCPKEIRIQWNMKGGSTNLHALSLKRMWSVAAL